ncbi:class I SAM-dependent methyltransferase [Dysgonomonas sp. 511]|uniref:class I SAM-dependent methyltransferase n=1 Tax=Dysgonomonas sp. 511 TaxID=2302930 RepID=UPI0013D7C310|nr:class I SAM-dependent methyltransferase [Dysgonomonas sp. 511]NDV78236.1 class I SAM-dependent methyltransferase [Dysgonomonas sp. 511]
MSKDLTTIVDFNYSLIADFFKHLNRQGPGSLQVTKQALSYIDNLSQVKNMADIGCGTGTQTLTLATNTNAHITAIDLIPEMIEVMDTRIVDAGMSDRITTIVGSMDNLPFEESLLDLMWAEGSIYGIGYERGMNEWHKYLKTGGYIAVSEATWFTNERPAEIEEFWNENYPEIDTAPVKIRQMQDAGYTPVAYFKLPEYTWIDCFFKEMPPVAKDFLTRNGNNETAKIFIEMVEHEESLYMKYKEYYGYGFYIGKKI